MLSLQSLTNLLFTKRTCKARADVNVNTSQQPIMLECFATFVISMHIINFAFK